jgi:hypothetical protein
MEEGGSHRHWLSDYGRCDGICIRFGSCSVQRRNTTDPMSTGFRPVLYPIIQSSCLTCHLSKEIALMHDCLMRYEQPRSQSYRSYSPVSTPGVRPSSSGVQRRSEGIATRRRPKIPHTNTCTHTHLIFVTCGGAVLLCSRGHMGFEDIAFTKSWFSRCTVHIAYELFTCVVPSWVDDPPTGSFGALELSIID